MARTDDLPRHGAQQIRLRVAAGDAVGTERVFGDDIADAVVRLLPRAAAVDTVVAPVVLVGEGTLDGVPVPDAAVPFAPAHEQVPLRMCPDDGGRLVHERYHVLQAVGYDTCARSLAFQKVATVEEIPLPVVIAEGMGVDAEGFVRRQHPALILEGPSRMRGGRHAKLMPLAFASAGRVV